MKQAQQTAMRVAGVLILQLAVIAFAQETVPLVSSSGDSALPAGKPAAAESSQTPVGNGGASSANGAVTQSGKVGGLGDPAFGGERHPLYRLTKSDVVDLNFTFSS